MAIGTPMTLICGETAKPRSFPQPALVGQASGPPPSAIPTRPLQRVGRWGKVSQPSGRGGRRWDGAQSKRLEEDVYPQTSVWIALARLLGVRRGGKKVRGHAGPAAREWATGRRAPHFTYTARTPPARPFLLLLCLITYTAMQARDPLHHKGATRCSQGSRRRKKTEHLTSKVLLFGFLRDAGFVVCLCFLCMLPCVCV